MSEILFRYPTYYYGSEEDKYSPLMPLTEALVSAAIDVSTLEIIHYSDVLMFYGSSDGEHFDILIDVNVSDLHNVAIVIDTMKYLKRTEAGPDKQLIAGVELWISNVLDCIYDNNGYDKNELGVTDLAIMQAAENALV